MHIELTEMLRCPEPHPQTHLVLSTGEMLGRSVRSGVLGCPVCRREFRITAGLVDFCAPGRAAGPPPPAHAVPFGDYAATLQALLDLSGPGGIVALVGGAVHAAEGLAALMDGIHFVGINGPAGTAALPALSPVVAEDFIPLRDAVARGVVVGAGFGRNPWLAEAARVLLPGRRLVVEGAGDAPPGVAELAAAGGLWVGEKR